MTLRAKARTRRAQGHGLGVSRPPEPDIFNCIMGKTDITHNAIKHMQVRIASKMDQSDNSIPRDVCKRNFDPLICMGGGYIS